MSLFRRRPRCPLCKSSDHLGEEFHQQRFEELVTEIKKLQADLKEAEKDQFDEKAINFYVDMLWSAINDIYTEAFFLGLKHRVPELIRAHAS